MTEKCFKKCVSKPGTSLDNSEQVSTKLTVIILNTRKNIFRNVLQCVWIDIWTHGI